MRMVSSLAVALLLHAVAAGADVVQLKDGSRVEGSLTFCDEEVCRIDQRRVARAEITRITLRAVASAHALREPGVLLTDGAIRRGTVTGLTLGYVEIDGEEIDRETVALILLEAPSKDVLIGTSGPARSGVISSCNAASCTLDGEIVPFDDLRWIGLKAEGTSRPQAGDADTIFLRDQQPVAARLSSLDARTVRSTHGSFPREDVTWIRLASRRDDAQPGGPIVRPPSPGPTPPGAPPIQPPSPANTPPQPPAPGPPLPSGEPRRGSLWTGTIDGRGWGTVHDIFSDLRISVQVRLREYVYPLVIVKGGKLKTIGTISRLEPEGTVVRNVFRCSGPYLSCSGEGTTTVTIELEQQGAGHPNWVIHKTGSDSMQASLGYDIPQGAALYTLGIDTVHATYPVTYRSGERASTSDSGFAVWPIGRSPLDRSEYFDRERRFLQAGKMIGSYTSPGSGAFPHVSSSWAICREGVVCPQAAPLPESGGPPETDCSEGTQLDFAKLCRDQLARLLDELKPMLEEYERKQKHADQFWTDFKWAAAQCAAWKIAEAALEAVLGSHADELGDAGANAEKVREILKAMIEGDYGGLVTDADLWEDNEEFKNALENMNDFVGYLEKAGTVADLIAKNLNGIQGAVVDSCAGAVTPELHRKAQLFVDLSKEAATYYKEKVAVTKNDIRSKSLECLGKDHAAWKACVDAAACRGATSNNCGPDPMSGSPNP